MCGLTNKREVSREETRCSLIPCVPPFQTLARTHAPHPARRRFRATCRLRHRRRSFRGHSMVSIGVSKVGRTDLTFIDPKVIINCARISNSATIVRRVWDRWLVPLPVHQKVKVKQADLYSAFFEVPYTQGAQVRITQCYLQTTPYLPLPRKHSPDGASQTEVADI